MLQPQTSFEQQVLKLSRPERARMALYLLDSLEQERSPASKESIEKAWVDESLRRLDAYQRGDMQAYSVEEVIADLEGSAE